MKIKPRGIIIIILIILIFTAIFTLTKRLITPEDIFTNTTFVYSNEEKEYHFVSNAKELSKKYHAYEDIFEITEPTLIYGYSITSLDNVYGYMFHRKIKNVIKKNNINIKVITYPGVDSTVEKQESLNCKESKGSICSHSIESEEYFRLVDPIVDCLYNACIVYPNGKYIQYSRQGNVLEEKLKEYNNNSK